MSTSRFATLSLDLLRKGVDVFAQEIQGSGTFLEKRGDGLEAAGGVLARRQKLG